MHILFFIPIFANNLGLTFIITTHIMRTIILLFSLFAFFHVNAQDNTKALLTDGKVWHCVDKWLDKDMNVIERRFSVTVCGDISAEGRTCKELCMVYEDSPLEKNYFLMYEDGTKIYDFAPDNAQDGQQQLRLLLDFGLKVGDKAFSWNDDYEVVGEDAISVKNHTYRRLTINKKDKSGENIYWVEGIGTNNDSFITMIEKPTGAEGYSLHKNIVSCYDGNGACLFESEDFSTTNTTNITGIKSDKKPSSPQIYDLTGKKITYPQKGEVYIKDGRKHIKSH